MEITPLPWFLIGLNLESPIVEWLMYLFILDCILEICFISGVTIVLPCSIHLRGEERFMKQHLLGHC